MLAINETCTPEESPFSSAGPDTICQGFNIDQSQRVRFSLVSCRSFSCPSFLKSLSLIAFIRIQWVKNDEACALSRPPVEQRNGPQLIVNGIRHWGNQSYSTDSPE